MGGAAAWRLLLSEGLGAFGDAYYVGQLPFGEDLAMHEVLAASYRGAEVEFYFDLTSGDLVGLLLSAADDIDPCLIYFDDFRQIDGNMLPMTWRAYFGDHPYVEIHVERYQWERIATEEGP